MQSYLWLLLFLPIAGSAICGALHLVSLRARTRRQDVPELSRARGRTPRAPEALFWDFLAARVRTHAH